MRERCRGGRALEGGERAYIVRSRIARVAGEAERRRSWGAGRELGRGQGVRRGLNGEGWSAHELVVRLLLVGGYPNPWVTLTRGLP